VRLPNEERDHQQRLKWADWNRAYYWRNAEAERKRKREYYHQNREKVLAMVRRYREEIKRLA
jgi:hypothetical protein